MLPSHVPCETIRRGRLDDQAMSATGASTESSSSSPPFSGLHSLVEAAEALTKLVGTSQAHSGTDATAEAQKPPPPGVSSVDGAKKGPPTIVSEDESTAAPTANSTSTDVSVSANDVQNTVALHSVTPPPSPKTKPKSGKGRSSHKRKKSGSAAADGKAKSRRPHKKDAKKAKAASPKDSSGNKSKPEIFPLRLMRMLLDASLRPIITWLPHGRSFVILQPDVFAERVLPIYFPESSTSSSASAKDNSSNSAKAKYPSFTRKLNRWGFRQVSQGQDAGAFQHSFFRRDEPHLCLSMECEKSGSRGGGSGVKKGGVTANGSELTTPPGDGGSVPRSSPPLKKRKLLTTPELAAAESGTTSKSNGAPSPSKQLAPAATPNFLSLPAEISFPHRDGKNNLPPPPRLAEASSPRSQQPPQAVDFGTSHVPQVEAGVAALRELLENARGASSVPAVAVHQKTTQHQGPVPSHRYEPNLYQPHNIGHPLTLAPQGAAATAASASASSGQPNTEAMSTTAIEEQQKATEEHRSMLYRAYLQALNS